MSTVEVRKRDGLARIATLIIGDKTCQLPTVLDTGILFDGLSGSRMENVPLGADPAFVAQYLPRDRDFPAWVHPSGENIPGHGTCVMVPCWHTAFANPRRYVEWLKAMKSALPPDTAWYAPGAALPSNAAILCYSGFDILDFTAVDLRSAQGRFCIPEGEFPGDRIGSGVCTCPGCRSGDLKEHNRLALVRELALAREYIACQRLRDLVESRCRMDAAQVAILRHIDRARGFFEKAVPVARAGTLLATTGEVLQRPEVARFSERVVGRYRPPPADVAVLLPCSARKPYSSSQSHRRFRQAIAGRALELIVTSPLGLVPRELELVYPAAHYDVPVTGYWDAEEREFVGGIIGEFLEKHRFKRVIAHLEGGALAAAETGAARAGIGLEITCTGRPTSHESLALLDSALSGENRVRHDAIRGTSSWQFDLAIDTRNLVIKGRYPWIRAFRGRTPSFSIDEATGLLRPTFEGWNMIPEGYRVLIDEFVPTGDVLAPGVVDADPRIREGDEVLVTGPCAIATGRAAMPADEMLRSGRGVAVRVRKVKTLPRT
ncbi:MAG: Archaeosine synthase [Methanoregulaceae archaeon PtaB.Bin009]|nr:MAG: Archaeosine synthase [Methanoregulaceae archaeon PtaB.Bin009]OPY40465.1 MAG: Archaeosine synthase [Methanoregulaceae archaeon PtaU1.Bin066]